MNNKLAKKIRRGINKKVRTDMEDLARTLSEVHVVKTVNEALRVIGVDV
ncbi:MAG: hypothetical protein AB1432_05590 [Bacteroidota bacterium]|jgi:hypothetical protein